MKTPDGLVKAFAIGLMCANVILFALIGYVIVHYLIKYW